MPLPGGFMIQKKMNARAAVLAAVIRLYLRGMALEAATLASPKRVRFGTKKSAESSIHFIC